MSLAVYIPGIKLDKICLWDDIILIITSHPSRRYNVISNVDIIKDITGYIARNIIFGDWCQKIENIPNNEI